MKGNLNNFIVDRLKMHCESLLFLALILILYAGCDKSEPTVVKISISPDDITVNNIDTSIQFTAKAYDDKNNEISGKNFTWESEDTLIARVDSSGLATAICPGTSKIYVYCGDKSAYAIIKVCMCIEEHYGDDKPTFEIDCTQYLINSYSEGELNLEEAFENGAIDTADNGEINMLQRRICE